MTWIAPTPALTVPCLLLLAMTGCSQALNDRITLGGSNLPPVFDESTHGARTGAPVLFGEGPTPRSAWTPTIYIAPFDGVVHGHDLILRARLDKFSAPREYGRYPTRRDALALQSSGWLDDLMMTLDELGRSFVGTPYALVYWTWAGELCRPEQSPFPYKRTAQVGWASGFPAPDDPAERQANPQASPLASPEANPSPNIQASPKGHPRVDRPKHNERPEP